MKKILIILLALPLGMVAQEKQKKSTKAEFKVVERWIETAEKIGFKYNGMIKMMLNTRPGVGNDKLEGREKFEGVYIFKK